MPRAAHRTLVMGATLKQANDFITGYALDAEAVAADVCPRTVLQARGGMLVLCGSWWEIPDVNRIATAARERGVAVACVTGRV